MVAKTGSYNIKGLGAAPLSKSKFIHGMQCPLHLWLEVRTDVPQRPVDAFTQSLFEVGHEVGEQARRRWDARLADSGKPVGVRVSDDPREHALAVKQTARAIREGAEVIHEAAFTHSGVKVRVDVLERLADGSFAVNEVKSTTGYDPEKHLLDAAVQLWVVRGSGVQVSQVRLVHLNSEYVWPGGPYDLERLFAEEDVTAAAELCQPAVSRDVERLLGLLRSDVPPSVSAQTSCSKPYECPYLEVCPVRGVRVEHPISELPGRTDSVVRRAAEQGIASLLELDEPAAGRLLRYADGSLHPVWYHTWRATTSGERIILDDCPAWITALEHPVRHLDFETIAPALPVVPNTRPFQVVPLQYSVHVENPDGTLEHRELLADADEPDPRLVLIEQLLEDVGEGGSIIHWSQYEHRVLSSLAADPRYLPYRERLEAVIERLADLGKAVDRWVFDKEFHGKWSLKQVYPALVSGKGAAASGETHAAMSYADLEGVARGDEAAMMLLEYLCSTTPAARRAQIRRELLAYCALDTRATVEVLAVLRSECFG